MLSLNFISDGELALMANFFGAFFFLVAVAYNLTFEGSDLFPSTSRKN
jgi:hypothetical protein